jgi:hypothetical protein
MDGCAAPSQGALSGITWSACALLDRSAAPMQGVVIDFRGVHDHGGVVG